MTEATVVQLTVKRVRIQVQGRLVLVNPTQLRRTDDPAVVAGFEKRKRR